MHRLFVVIILSFCWVLVNEANGETQRLDIANNAYKITKSYRDVKWPEVEYPNEKYSHLGVDCTIINNEAIATFSIGPVIGGNSSYISPVCLSWTKAPGSIWTSKDHDFSNTKIIQGYNGNVIKGSLPDVEYSGRVRIEWNEGILLPREYTDKVKSFKMRVLSGRGKLLEEWTIPLENFVGTYYSYFTIEDKLQVDIDYPGQYVFVDLGRTQGMNHLYPYVKFEVIGNDLKINKVSLNGKALIPTFYGYEFLENGKIGLEFQTSFNIKPGSSVSYLRMTVTAP